MAGEAPERRQQLLRGAQRVYNRTRGSETLSSAGVLREVIGQIATQTGNRGYLDLVEDALSSQLALGMMQATIFERDPNNRNAQDAARIAEEGKDWKIEDAGIARQTQELARKSAMYEELALTPLIVATEEAMGETLERDAIAMHQTGLTASLTERASKPEDLYG